MPTVTLFPGFMRTPKDFRSIKKFFSDLNWNVEEMVYPRVHRETSWLSWVEEVERAWVGHGWLLGVSMGGMLAQELARRHEVEGLLLMSTRLPHPLGFSNPIIDRLFVEKTQLDLEDVFKEYVGKAFYETYGLMISAMAREWQELWRDPVQKEQAEGQIRVLRGYQGVWERAPSRRVHVLHGQEDRIITQGEAERLVSFWQGSLRLVPSCGHMLLAEGFLEVQDWLRALFAYKS